MLQKQFESVFGIAALFSIYIFQQIPTTQSNLRFNKIKITAFQQTKITSVNHTSRMSLHFVLLSVESLRICCLCFGFCVVAILHVCKSLSICYLAQFSADVINMAVPRIATSLALPTLTYSQSTTVPGIPASPSVKIESVKQADDGYIEVEVDSRGSTGDRSEFTNIFLPDYDCVRDGAMHTGWLPKR